MKTTSEACENHKIQKGNTRNYFCASSFICSAAVSLFKSQKHLDFWWTNICVWRIHSHQSFFFSNSRFKLKCHSETYFSHQAAAPVNSCVVHHRGAAEGNWGYFRNNLTVTKKTETIKIDQNSIGHYYQDLTFKVYFNRGKKPNLHRLNIEIPPKKILLNMHAPTS